jgi:hypothetical protein
LQTQYFYQVKFLSRGILTKKTNQKKKLKKLKKQEIWNNFNIRRGSILFYVDRFENEFTQATTEGSPPNPNQLK